jgi:ElaB/YqjD/DUF883 family membrane-anchored ribosome-binding protein
MNAKLAPEGELSNFVADVEELVTKLGDVKDAEVARLRTKVRNTLDAAKEGVTNGTQALKERARQVAGSTDDYVRASPWQAVGIAALVGLAVGYVAAARRS